MALLETRYKAIIEDLKDLDDRTGDILIKVRLLLDWSFTGHKILKARKAAETSPAIIIQGHNIKLLAFASILFLPQIFVASLFGMKNMPSQGPFVPFGITLASICGPLFFLMLPGLFTLQGPWYYLNKWLEDTYYQASHWISQMVAPFKAIPRAILNTVKSLRPRREDSGNMHGDRIRQQESTTTLRSFDVTRGDILEGFREWFRQ